MADDRRPNDDALAEHYRKALSRVNGHIGISPTDPTLREIRREVEEAFEAAEWLTPDTQQQEQQQAVEQVCGQLEDAIRRAFSKGWFTPAPDVEPADPARILEAPDKLRFLSAIQTAACQVVRASLEPATQQQDIDGEGLVERLDLGWCRRELQTASLNHSTFKANSYGSGYWLGRAEILSRVVASLDAATSPSVQGGEVAK